MEILRGGVWQDVPHTVLDSSDCIGTHKLSCIMHEVRRAVLSRGH